MKIITSIIFLLIFVSVSHADTIELNNGKTFEGTFNGRDGDSINFDVDGIPMSFKASDVKNISMGAGDKSSDNKKAAAKPESNDLNKKATIPAGTRLVIRIGETLSTQRHKKGHKFTAKLESAVVIDGKTIVPVNSNVYGVISEITSSRRVAGKSSIQLGVTDIRINGQMHPIKTSELAGVTEGTAKKSAGQVARGAAIGALADGSSGAKTGAKVGLGVAVLSGGNQAQVPAGTLLEFTLLEAVDL